MCQERHVGAALQPAEPGGGVRPTGRLARARVQPMWLVICFSQDRSRH